MSAYLLAAISCGSFLWAAAGTALVVVVPIPDQVLQSTQAMMWAAKVLTIISAWVAAFLVLIWRRYL